MVHAGCGRLLIVAVQAAVIVSLVGGPAVIAAEPPDPVATEAAPGATPDPATAPPTEPAVDATATPVEPSVEPSGAPTPEPSIDIAPDPTAQPTAEPTTSAPAPEAQEPVVAPEYTGTIETLTAVVAEPAEVHPGDPVTLTATVTPNPLCGSVRFTYNDLPTDVALDANGMAQATITALAGTAPATAEFLGCGEYSSSLGTVDVVARYVSQAYLESTHETAVQYETTVTLTGYVWGSVTPTGTVTFARLVDGNPVALGTGELVDGVATLARSNLPVGSHELVLSYPGDAFQQPAVSDPIPLTITGDASVKVTLVGVQYARFYPVHDSYRDTDIVRGRTLERASVTIRIYNSGGTRLKSWSLGTKNGSYSATWNGRRSDGTLLAAGTYKVKQSFKDMRGNTRTVSKDVVLSHKKLYWYVKSQTRYADTGAFYYSGYGGAYHSTRYSRGVLLDGGYYDDDAALARYTFSLPSATIYRSVRVSVYGKSISPYGKGGMLLWNYSSSEYDASQLLGYSTNWYSSSVSAAGHVSSGRYVRAYVAAVGSNYGLVDYQKVKLTYKYAVLR